MILRVGSDYVNGEFPGKLSERKLYK